MSHRKRFSGNSPAVQWLGLHACIARGTGSIPSRGTKIPQATHCGQKIRKRKKKEKDLPLGSEWSGFTKHLFIMDLGSLRKANLCVCGERAKNQLSG